MQIFSRHSEDESKVSFTTSLYDNLLAQTSVCFPKWTVSWAEFDIASNILEDNAPFDHQHHYPSPVREFPRIPPSPGFMKGYIRRAQALAVRADPFFIPAFHMQSYDQMVILRQVLLYEICRVIHCRRASIQVMECKKLFVLQLLSKFLCWWNSRFVFCVDSLRGAQLCMCVTLTPACMQMSPMFEIISLCYHGNHSAAMVTTQSAWQPPSYHGNHALFL